MKINCPICDKNIKNQKKVKTELGIKLFDFFYRCKKCKFIFLKNEEVCSISIYDDFKNIKYRVSTVVYKEENNKGYFNPCLIKEQKCPGAFYAISFEDRPSPYMSRTDFNFKQINFEDYSDEKLYSMFLEWFNK